MDVTRERISPILELREMPLLLQIGFNHVYADVICVTLKSVSALELTSVKSEPRYFKRVTISSFRPFTLISVLVPLGVVCHQLGLLGTDLHAVGCGGFVKTLN